MKKVGELREPVDIELMAEPETSSSVTLCLFDGVLIGVAMEFG